MNPDVYKGQMTDLRSTMVMYGGLTSADMIRNIHKAINILFNLLGYPANVMAVSRNNKHTRYHRSSERAMAVLKKEDLTSISLAYVPTHSTDALRSGLLLAGGGMQGPSGANVILEGKINIVNLDIMAGKIIPSIADVYPTIYGYSYVLDAPYGPDFHVVGVGFGSPKTRQVPLLPESDKERGSRWFNQHEQAIPQGILRDVFPVNYLTEIHSTKKIGGRLLFDWITQDSSRGVLTEVKPNGWLWRVPEERCLEIGKQFESAGLLI